MAKRKTKNLRGPKSPLELAANDSVTPEAKVQHDYRLTRYAERDFEGGVSLDGIRLERIACVKALEGLARAHPKRKTPFLEQYHLMAANAYHADLLATEGSRSHAFRERIDASSSSEGGLAHRMDVMQKLGHVEAELGAKKKAILDRILVQLPDNTMTQIWPDRTHRNKARDLIKSALHDLAILYGLAR